MVSVLNPMALGLNVMAYKAIDNYFVSRWCLLDKQDLNAPRTIYSILCTLKSKDRFRKHLEIDFLWVFQDVFAVAFSSSLEIIAAHVFRNILLFFISFLHTVSSFTEKSGRMIKIEHFWMNQIESSSIWWKCIKNRIVTKRAIVCDCCCCLFVSKLSPSSNCDHAYECARACACAG